MTENNADSITSLTWGGRHAGFPGNMNLRASRQNRRLFRFRGEIGMMPGEKRPKSTIVDNVARKLSSKLEMLSQLEDLYYSAVKLRPILVLDQSCPDAEKLLHQFDKRLKRIKRSQYKRQQQLWQKIKANLQD